MPHARGADGQRVAAGVGLDLPAEPFGPVDGEQVAGFGVEAVLPAAAVGQRVGDGPAFSFQFVEFRLH